MSNFRRTIVVSDDLSAYRFRVRQRTLLEKLRYLQSKTKQTELHIGENDWKIINAALLEQSNQRRSAAQRDAGWRQNSIREVLAGAREGSTWNVGAAGARTTTATFRSVTGSPDTSTRLPPGSFRKTTNSRLQAVSIRS